MKIKKKSSKQNLKKKDGSRIKTQQQVQNQEKSVEMACNKRDKESQ